MHYLLDLPSIETRHKVEQVKAYLNAMQNPKNPLNDAVKEEYRSNMGQAEQSIQHVCSLAELKQVIKGLGENVQMSSSPTTRLCCHRT